MKNLEEAIEIFESHFNLNTLAEKMYLEAKGKGFHPDDEQPNLANYLMNLHGEISELWEAYRKGQLNELCDKSKKMKELGLGELTCFEEELADIIIRAFDTAGAFKIDVAKAVYVKMMFNRSRPFRNGGKLA